MFLKQLFILSVFSFSLLAHNNLYLPGDAFFSGKITKYKNGSLHLEYSSFNNWEMECGYLGYRKIIIKNIHLKDVKTLQSLVKKLKKRPKKKSDTFIEGPRILIYNKGFSLKNRLCLRYNENWSKLQLKYRHDAIYPDLLSEPSILDNWRNAHKVTPLKISIKDFKGSDMGEKKSLLVERKNIKFVILPPCEPSKASVKKVTFYVLDENLRRFSPKKKK